MPELSGSKLAELTGKSWRTVKKRLAEALIYPIRTTGTTDFYESVEALRAIYVNDSDPDELDANRERARRDKEHADKLALDNKLRRGELSVTETTLRSFGALISAARARLIQIPDALGQFCDARYAPVIVAEARKR